MYNSKHISTFIDKVHLEATLAAQAVYDKYADELEAKIKAQLRAGDRLVSGMGLSCITNHKGEDVGQSLEEVITPLNYWDKLQAGFDLVDIIKDGDTPIDKPKVNRIRLSRSVISQLDRIGSAVIYLYDRIPPAKGSIRYGIGYGTLFDRIDYKWVYGDIQNYKVDMMNVGRRAKDYPDNKGNRWNGSYWWDCESTKTSYPKCLKIGDIINNTYIIKDIQITEIYPKIRYKLQLAMNCNP